MTIKCVVENHTCLISVQTKNIIMYTCMTSFIRAHYVIRCRIFYSLFIHYMFISETQSI